jgi:hypothetical protein
VQVLLADRVVRAADLPLESREEALDAVRREDKAQVR